MSDEANAREQEVVGPALGTTRSGVRPLAPIFERVAPYLTIASTLLVLLGTWAPWAVNTVTLATPIGPRTSTAPLSGDALGLSILFQLLHPQPAQVDRPVIFWSLTLLSLLWDALPLSGLLLSLAVWQHASRVVLRLYLAWLTLSTVATAFVLGRTASMAGVHACSNGCMTLDTQITWGVWVTLAALGLAWLALWLLTRRRAEQPASASAPPRTGLIGVGAFALGVVLWAMGILVLPWVTAGCVGIPLSLTHFSRGSCMGLDGYDVLSAAIYNAPQSMLTLSDLDIALDALHIIELLCALGAFLLLLLWRPRRTHSLRVPAACWLVLATMVFALCWYGTSIRLVKGGEVAYTTAPFVVGPAVALSIIALLLGWVGGVVIWLRKR